ncbi:hypothetical protein LOD99_12290 [Oopsacas minuta]|uniref:Uncharacterized protein n=1 Tax=Oopsacas minuta TaxID=111878 RepID=A0AAV7JEN9_9METZ|nr:hypothetical protein LOD99_12290 [Oopsacas minuta]
MAECLRLTDILASKEVKDKTVEQLSKVLKRTATKTTITSVYTKLSQYISMYEDTVMAKRYTVLKKGVENGDTEIAVKLAKEEIIFYIMCEKFRGEDVKMECDKAVTQGVKRRGSQRSNLTPKSKKYKLNVD